MAGLPKIIREHLYLLVMIVVFVGLFMFAREKAKVVDNYIDFFAYMNGEGCKAVKYSQDSYVIDCSEYKKVQKRDEDFVTYQLTYNLTIK